MWGGVGVGVEFQLIFQVHAFDWMGSRRTQIRSGKLVP